MSIRVEDLTKSFGSQAAVRNISLDIPEGSFFCVLGPSGCGKSTLLRLIAGLETPDAGRVTLDGTAVFGDGLFVPPEDRRVGVVFQSYALWPHLSVQANVAFPYEAKGLSRHDAMQRAAGHLETVALEAYAERRPQALSGGQRQRVALARCLAGDARTILMDEPLANLDPHLRNAMETELRNFHDQSGVTTLYITHDQREAMALADVIAVMEAGEILQIGAPQEIYERPATKMVAGFIGRGALLPTMVRDGIARFGDQSVPVKGQGEGKQTIFVRPENISVGDTGWPARVTAVHYRGGLWEAEVEGEAGASGLMINLDRPVRVGEVVHLMFRTAWVLPG